MTPALQNALILGVVVLSAALAFRPALAALRNLTRYKAFLLLLMAVFLTVSSFQQRGLNHARERMGLTRLKPLENAPPLLAFTTVALGGFRGLIANALWIRASDLQDNGKYFEMVQLADWITKLQPYISTVWYHLGWNMAYNISIKFQQPEERWPWVLRGIELLRDQGLQYNPKETILYRELAWFFQHKIGHFLDDAHMFYKQKWGVLFAETLLNNRPDYDELINPKTEDGKRRSKLLQEKFKMNALWMQEIDQQYGPFEWRLPEAHAIYWAWAGQKNGNVKDQITLRRVIFQCMQLAFSRGALVENKIDKTLTLGPNLDIIPNASKSYEEMMEQEKSEMNNFATGHKNFLRKAVYHLYTYNRKREADRWFKVLKEKFPGSVAANKTLDDYAVEQVTEDASETNMDETTAVIRGLLVNSLLELAQDEDDRAVNYELLAQRIWKRYAEKIGAQSAKRVGLPAFNILREQVRTQMLDPEQGVSPTMAGIIRTKLGLPTPTNAPPASVNGEEKK